jgi:hypothetical protein
MKLIIVLVFAIMLSGCMDSAAYRRHLQKEFSGTQDRPELAPKSPYKQVGATVYSPNEEGWFLSTAPSNEFSIFFGKIDGTSNNSTMVNTVIFRKEGFENDTEFLNHIAEQMIQKDDKSRFKFIDFSNEQVSYKNTACLKYQSLVEDHWELGINSDYFLYFKTSGYVCRHPLDKSVAFRMEVSHRSGFKEFPKGLLQSGDAFFSTIQLNDNGL